VTLITGAREAVLVDALFTEDQAYQLVDWILASGKDLRAIYITHGHGDHFFGAGILVEHFANVRVVARPQAIELMRKQAARDTVAQFWLAQFPGQIPDRRVIAQPVGPEGITIEGYRLIPVDAGHTDTENTTFLHVPDVDLVVAGDVAYNGVHLYLAESDPAKRQEWLAALHKLEALRPKAVIAGHKRPGSDDGPHIIEETRQYIRDFDALAINSDSPQSLYQEMLTRHPDRMNPGALWVSAVAVLNQQRPQAARH
jgi:glyoxylase-like metal-dependent hydrolase (beta-lactamase superfamily II)